MKYNIAIAGFGKSGEIFHAPFITDIPELQLIKVQERHKQRSREIYPYVSVVTAYNDLINDKAVDIVVITTPNCFHYSMAKEALLAGKHVVVDKPFTCSAAEASDLIDIAKNKNRILTVYHNRRLDGTFLTVKEYIEEKILGEVQKLEIRFDRYRPNVNTESWRESKNCGTGLLYDLGSHLIDQALVLFGLPEKISAKVEKQRDKALTDDYFNISLFYSGNIEVLLHAGMLEKEKTNHYRLICTNGTLVIPDLDPQENALKAGLNPFSSKWPETFKAVETTDKGEQEKTFKAGNYCQFYRNLILTIEGKAELLVKPEEAFSVIELIEKVKG